MARKYSRKASADVERAMKKRKTGTLRSGRSGRKVKSRKQAIAIGLSEARPKAPRCRRRLRKEADGEKAEGKAIEFSLSSPSALICRSERAAKRADPEPRDAVRDSGFALRAPRNDADSYFKPPLLPMRD